MTMLQSFHDVRFPIDLALGATGGPSRRTEIVTLGSGSEKRNARWHASRRKYNVGYGIKTVVDLQAVISFFEERRGRLFGFRFKDPVDWKSTTADMAITPLDQTLGAGNGVTTNFPLIKQYGDLATGYQRRILKPLIETLMVAVDGVPANSSTWEFDHSEGVLKFASNAIPANGSIITAGFEFDVPVRFDLDEIAFNLTHFEAGDIPAIPLVELI